MQDEVPRIFEAVFQCTLEVTDSVVHIWFNLSFICIQGTD